MSRRTFGTVRKRRNGRYDIRYVGPDDERYSGGRSFPSKRTAEQALSNIQSSIYAGTWVPPQAAKAAAEAKAAAGITLRAYSDQWLRSRLKNGRPLAARTRDDYRTLLDKHILPDLGDLAVSDIDRKTVAKWHDATLVDRPTYRAHAYSLLRTIMITAVQDGLSKVQPCTLPGAGTVKRASSTTPAASVELSDIEGAMPDEFRMTVTLGGWCAVRAGEALGLQRRDVRVQDCPTPIAPVVTILIRRQYLHTGETRTETKSAAGMRSVVVPPHVSPKLFTHLDSFVRAAPDAWLFPSPQDATRPVSRTTLYKQWYYPARAAAGRPDLRFHDLRHTGAVLAAQAGATIKELQDRLGHSTPSAAMRYQHAAAGRAAEIAARMSQLNL